MHACMHIIVSHINVTNVYQGQESGQLRISHSRHRISAQNFVLHFSRQFIMQFRGNVMYRMPAFSARSHCQGGFTSRYILAIGHLRRNRCADRQTDRQTASQTNRQTDGVTLLPARRGRRIVVLCTCKHRKVGSRYRASSESFGTGHLFFGPGRPFTKPGKPFTGPDKPFTEPGKPFTGPGKPFTEPGNPFTGPGKPFTEPGKPFTEVVPVAEQRPREWSFPGQAQRTPTAPTEVEPPGP